MAAALSRAVPTSTRSRPSIKIRALVWLSCNTMPCPDGAGVSVSITTHPRDVHGPLVSGVASFWWVAWSALPFGIGGQPVCCPRWPGPYRGLGHLSYG